MWSWKQSQGDLPTGSSSPNKRSAVAPAQSTPKKPLGPPPTQGPPPGNSQRLPGASPPQHHHSNRPGMTPRASKAASSPVSPQYTVFAPPTAKPSESTTASSQATEPSENSPSVTANFETEMNQRTEISAPVHPVGYESISSHQVATPDHSHQQTVALETNQMPQNNEQSQQQTPGNPYNETNMEINETPHDSLPMEKVNVEQSETNQQLVDSDNYEAPIAPSQEQALTIAQEQSPSSLHAHDPSTTSIVVSSSPTKTPEENRKHFNHTSPQRETRLVKHSFHFVGDERRVVSEWNAWEEHSLRQRQEFNSRVHELTCHTAHLTAAVARESTQRYEQLENSFLANHVLGPLNLLVDRCALIQDEFRYDSGSTQNDESIDSPPLTSPEEKVMPPPPPSASGNSTSGNGGNYLRFKTLSARISALDSHMGKSIFEIIPQVRREKLSCLMYDLQELVKTTRRHRLEASKAEGVLATKLENVAGRVATMYQQEHTTRCTVVAVANTRAFGDDGNGDFLGTEHSKVQQLLSEIKGLRQQLARQRQERQKQDAYVQKLIESKSAAMRSALLEAVGDPDD